MSQDDEDKTPSVTEPPARPAGTIIPSATHMTLHPPVDEGSSAISEPTYHPAPDDEVADPAEGPTMVARSVPVSRLMAGERIGRFILDRVIGEGATASVWSAHHESLGTPVAIKVFYEHHRDFTRVLGEARAAAGILSPHVIWVYDVGSFDGHHVIIMELSGHPDGRTAQSLREDGPLNTRDAVRLMAQAARGVQEAHKVHVFHKDIKPANILKHPVDARAQLTDFGLANPELWRVLKSVSARPARSTVCVDGMTTPPAAYVDPLAIIRGSVRIGTPEFMAPEQAIGLRHDLDPEDPQHQRYLAAIDVYGLGATLYALLAGHAPYPLADEDTTDAHEIMEQVRSGIAPSLRKTTTQFHVPARLSRIVEKAMAYDPFKRHSSVEALAEDLEQWLRGRTTSIDTGPIQRLRVNAWRERWRVGLPSLALTATFAVLAYNSVLIGNQQTRLENQRTMLRESRAEYESLSKKADRTSAQLKGTQSRLKDREEMLTEARNALDRSNTTLEDRESQLANAQVDLQVAQASIDELMENIENNDATLMGLESDRDNLRNELNQKTASLDLAKEEADEAQRKLAATYKELTKMEQELQAVFADKQRLATRVAALQDELEAKADEDLSRTGESAGLIDQLEADKATLVEKVGDLEMELSRVTARARNFKKQMQALQDELELLRGEAPAP